MPELHPYDVIRRPVVTEKTNAMMESLNHYVFEVAPNANKIQIKDAVELIFGKEDAVLKVQTMIVPAKRGRRGRKYFLRTRQWKKAVVTLAEGQKIELFNV